MNVLILTYACKPEEGSEYEVGWKVPTTLAVRYPEHQFYVVTRGNGHENLNENENSNKNGNENENIGSFLGSDNLHFMYYSIPSWLTYPNERGSRWGEQINYVLWQLMVRGKVKEWCKKYHIDVVHHLTYNQYRTPSPGYWVNLPFVVGPIGGAELISPIFYQDLEPHTLRKEKIRVKGWDRKIFRWLLSRTKSKKVVLCSNSENMDRLVSYKGDAEMMVLPAIAIDPVEFKGIGNVACSDDVSANDLPFTMICASKAWDWKGLYFVLKAIRKAIHLHYHAPNNSSLSSNLSALISQLSSQTFHLKLVGIRFEDEQKRVNAWINEFGLQQNVELIPFVPRSELLKMEAECDLNVYPAFRDSGSMAVLEACALGCPSICFDAGGQDIFPDEILLKVPVAESYDECLNAFAEKLLWAYSNRKELKEIGLKSQKWVRDNLTWEKKTDEFLCIYESLISNLQK